MDIRITNFYQDFNFLMEDSSIKHFEFQSSDLSLDDLKRFRSYEAVTSYQYKSAVTTYVVCSGKIKKPRTEFTEGINTYQIIPIRLAEWNADEFIRTLEEKGQSGKLITRNDLVLLTLSPIRIIRHKLEKGISADIVADFLEEDPDYIKQIYALIQSQPNLTDLQIAELVLNERKKDIN